MTLTNQTVGIPWSQASGPADVLIFEDLFETFNAANWSSESKTFNYGGGQALAGTTYARNAFVSAATSGGTGNTLKLQAVREPDTTVTPAAAWTTAQLHSGSKFEFRMPCRVEVRCKLAYGNGIRNAFWLARGTASGHTGTTSEIDIVEHFAGGSSYSASNASLDLQTGIFWTYVNRAYGRTFYNSTRAETSTAWNVFHIEITNPAAPHIAWFKNGVQYHAHGAGEPQTWSTNTPNDTPPGTLAPDVPPYPEPFSANTWYRLRLGMEPGSTATNNSRPGSFVDGTTPSPSTFEVDYVRVYQLPQ